jgi:hypothetical protein
MVNATLGLMQSTAFKATQRNPRAIRRVIITPSKNEPCPMHEKNHTGALAFGTFHSSFKAILINLGICVSR